MSFRDRDDVASIPEITVEFSNSTAAFDEPDGADDASTYAPSSLANNSSLLSPRNATNFPRDGRASPTVDSSDSSCPPSPTISDYSSSHFPTSTALRYNHPDIKYGIYSKPNSDQSHTASTTDFSESGLPPPAGNVRHIGSTTSDVKHVDDLKEQNMPLSSTNPLTKQPNSIDQTDVPTAAEHTELAPFTFDPNLLAQMLDPKNIETLVHLGGTEGLLKGLGTDPVYGVNTQFSERGGPSPEEGPVLGAPHRHNAPEKTRPTHTDPPVQVQTNLGSFDSPTYRASLADRRRVYGENVLPRRPSKSLLYLMWSALNDKVLILLSIAAVVSLALGLFQDFGTPRTPGEPPVDWVEGVAIIIAILIVVLVGSLNDWQKERQFQLLNKKKDERGVKVIRDGAERIIDIEEVVVGDIALLEPGEVVPCDGVFLSGYSVKCDESGATGESDAIKKISYEEWVKAHDANSSGGKKDLGHTDCFVLSGSKILEGVGHYVVVAVGIKSFNGRIMMALRGDSENTPLQLKLNDLAELIAKLGSVAGLTLFTALMIRFFVQLGQHNPPRNANQNGIAFVNILIISVTLIVVAVPEGLPLAVTLALAFATKRMTKEKLLVRVLGSCETMANASVICTDKTGTLTQNKMMVVAGSIGVHAKFVRQLSNGTLSPEETEEQQEPGCTRRFPEDFSINHTELNIILAPQLHKLFNEAIAVNSTAFEDIDPVTKGPIFVGSKTESALLQFAKDLDWPDIHLTRQSARITQMIPFSSERKAMGVVVQLPNGRWRAHFKGASEILTRKCDRYVSVQKNLPEQANDGLEVKTKSMDEQAEENIKRTIIYYANQSLRTIALCYREFDRWPPVNARLDDRGDAPFEHLAQELTLLGIVGIEDPLRDGVRDAVFKCHKAGVAVKMCTGDNILTARSIASQCGIYTPGGVIIEGPSFRKLSPAERLEIVPSIQVLARSSPEDKKILVETLKRLGHIVGVTGDGTNDGPALKTADVGFSMGIAGTEVAKEASDIILMDDNFASIVKAIIWGRCVNDAVRKFLQFQISANVTAVVVTFVSAVASAQEQSVLTAVQLLWINIIMDTFAALALATDPASESLLDRKPDDKRAPLFSTDMYKMILFQSTYQVAVTLIFHFLGLRILGLSNSKHNQTVIQTLVFNAFVFSQIFNSINCRRLDRKLNILEGVLKNYYFITITLIEIGVQILIVFVGGAAFQVTKIPGREWGISIALGFGSLPVGILARLLPNGPFERGFRAMGLFGRRKSILPVQDSEPDGWNHAISLVRDNLKFFASVRGGRLRSSSFVAKSRLAKIHPEMMQQTLKTSSILTMAPTLMAGAIAGGQHYAKRDLSDPAQSDPSKSSAALFIGRTQLHPGTPLGNPTHLRLSLPARMNSKDNI
ncbi:hypothetical protein AX15_004145 [Amanita polypyramis BW_CC]|nr:hypothetical protein AX15_004145 [Amanita polypyramis BW_CC]